MSEVPQIFENPFDSTFCEMFNCMNRNDYILGRPQEGALVMPGSMRLCNSCAISVVKNLPEPLLVHVDVEKALSLMSEEQKDAIFDKFFPAADPKDVLDNLLETMEEEDVTGLLVEHGYLLDEEQPDPGKQEQSEVKEPVVYSSLDRNAPIEGDNGLLKCPHCDYETDNPLALRGHIGGKHKAVKQD